MIATLGLNPSIRFLIINTNVFSLVVLLHCSKGQMSLSAVVTLHNEKEAESLCADQASTPSVVHSESQTEGTVKATLQPPSPLWPDDTQFRHVHFWHGWWRLEWCLVLVWSSRSDHCCRRREPGFPHCNK